MTSPTSFSPDEPTGNRGDEARVSPERRTPHDRRVQAHFVFRDLRSGFDRRRHYPLLGVLRDNDLILLGVLVLTNVLSAIDGYLTLREISMGIASEGNPVLAGLFEAHPLAAVSFKVFSVAMVSAIIWMGRRLRAMLALALFACAVFTAVVAYHLGSLAGLGLI